MSNPESSEDILQSHSGLIHRVVMHCNAPGSVPDIGQALETAEDSGQGQLVAIIREIMSGKREEAIPLGLDDESRTVAEAIIRGLQNPSTLPDIETDIESPLAAQGIAGIVYAARNGNGQSLRIALSIAKQMYEAGGDMAIMAHRIKPLVEGERDTAKLTQDMGDKGQTMMREIMDELSRLEGNRSPGVDA